MPTVEELLIGFKIDEGSVQKLSSDTKKTTEKISSDSKIDVKLTTNANDILAKVSDAIKQFKTDVQDSFSKMGSGVTDVGKEFDKLQLSISEIIKGSGVESTVSKLATDTDKLDSNVDKLSRSQSKVSDNTRSITDNLKSEKDAVDNIGSSFNRLDPSIQRSSQQMERFTSLLRSLGLGNIPLLGPLINGLDAYRKAMLLTTTATEANTVAASANVTVTGGLNPVLKGLSALYPTLSTAIGVNTSAYIAESVAAGISTKRLLEHSSVITKWIDSILLLNKTTPVSDFISKNFGNISEASNKFRKSLEDINSIKPLDTSKLLIDPGMQGAIDRVKLGLKSVDGAFMGLKDNLINKFLPYFGPAINIAISSVMSAFSKLPLVFSTTLSQLPALITQVGALTTAFGLLATAVGVVGSAFSGWQIGSWISNIIGLDKATERIVKGVDTIGDSLKMLLSIPLTGPFGYVMIAWTSYMKKLADEAKRFQEAKTLENLSKLGKNARKEFDRLRKEGLSVQAAFSQALDLDIIGPEFVKQLGSIRYEYLKNQDALGKLTDAQKSELAILELRFIPILKEQADAQKKLEESSPLGAMKALIASQKDYADAVKKTNDDLFKLREGEFSFSVKQLQENLDEQLKLYSDHGSQLATVINASNAEIARLQQSQPESPMIDVLKASVEKAAAGLAVVREQILKNQEIFNDRLNKLVLKQVDDLRSAAQKEIDIERNKADKVISEQERIINKAQDQVKRLIDIRKKGTEVALAFIEEQRQAELARQNQQRAELDRFATSAIDKLKSSIFGSKQQVEAFFDVFVKEAVRISQTINEPIKKTQEEIDNLKAKLFDIGKANVEIEKAFNVATTQTEKESQLDKINEQRRKAQEIQGQLIESEKKLTALKEQQALIQKDLTGFTDAASKAADLNIKNQEKSIKDIKTSSVAQQEALLKIKEAVDARVLAEACINIELDKQLKNLENYKLKQEAILKNAVLMAAKLGGVPIPATEQGTQATQGAQPVAQAQLNEAATGVQAAAVTVAAAEKQTALNAEAIKGKADEITRGFMDVAAKIGPLFTAMAASLDSAVKSLIPITEKFSLLLSSQASFGVSLSSFSESVVSKMEVMAEAFNGQASRLDTLTSRVDKIVLRRGNNEDIPAAGALPV